MNTSAFLDSPAAADAPSRSLAGATRAELARCARRGRRARTRNPHAHGAALALDLSSRRFVLRRHAQCQQGFSRPAERAFHAGAAADRDGAGLQRRHAEMADPAGACRKRRTAAPRSNAFIFPKRIAARYASRARSAARLTCAFCHTGTQKLVRNLTAQEIIAQVLIARERLGDFPGGVPPEDGLMPKLEAPRGLQRRLHGHGRAAL